MTDQQAFAIQKAARIAEETIRTAQACQAVVATGATGGDLAAALVEVAVQGEGRVRAIMAEPPPGTTMVDRVNECAGDPKIRAAISRGFSAGGPLGWLKAKREREGG